MRASLRQTDVRDMRLVTRETMVLDVDADNIADLLDTAQSRHRLPSRNQTWREIGISPSRGRSILARNGKDCTWPEFFTIRAFALD